MQAELDRISMERAGLYEYFTNIETGGLRGCFLYIFTQRAFDSCTCLADMTEEELIEFKNETIEAYEYYIS